jgi:EAL domain-containing protein (putative c-di-GMP-specific phosphodiesterase class I)
VDDQVEVTEALETNFHRKPFKIHTANSAHEAFRTLAQVPIDVIVSDENMPGMTGSRFLSLVRNKYPDVIRIILSGKADLSATLAAINSAQAHQFLIKPCSSEDIALCLTAALEERTAKKTGADPAPVRILHDFDAALSSLWIAFQPIMSAPTLQLFAYEALVRSDHPQLGSASELFAAAEQCNRLQDLERSTRELIGRSIARLPVDVSIMVNVHPSALLDADLFSKTSSLFPHRERIVFEITEREKLHEIATAEDIFKRLRGLGYRIAIDDLGAGYSGLNSLATMRPHIVKFDMELIRNIHLSPAKLTVVRTIALLCKEMGILTVAEGIENAEECAAAVALGCDFLQGYHLAPPARGSFPNVEASKTEVLV